MGTQTWIEWRQPSPGRAPLAEIEPGQRSLDDRSLVRYVLTARVDLLAERTYSAEEQRWLPAPPAVTYGRGAMAARLGYTSSQLSRLIGPGANLNRDQVLQLEHRLLTFAYVHRNATPQAVGAFGSLTAFWQELRGHGRRGDTHDRTTNLSSVSWNLALWFNDLCSVPPQSSASVLVLGEALVALLSAAETAEAVEVVWRAHEAQAELTMRAMVAVATGPPGAGAVDAIQLAALFGHRVVPIVVEHLKESPVGFRATRILTRMFSLAQGNGPPWWSGGGQAEVAAAWKALEWLDDNLTSLHDPYPARSFSVEALRVAARDERVPKARVLAALGRRYENASRPIRERLYAAYCLSELDPEHAQDLAVSVAQRADQDRAWSYLSTLLAAQQTSSLESLLLDGRSFANVQVPEGDLIHHHAGHAGEGDDGELSYLGRLPASVRRGTRQLIRYALLSPDGTTRRRACESLREAGVTREAVGVVAEVLLDAESPRWLQEIAAFVASYLNEESVAPVLERVAADPSRDVSVRHAAFSALGDLGVRSRRTIDAAIAAAREPGSSEALLLRAATYVLAVLWLDEGDAERTEAQLDALTRLYPAALQPDQVTRRLAGWGIENAAAISAATKSPQQVTIWGLGMPGPNSG